MKPLRHCVEAENAIDQNYVLFLFHSSFFILFSFTDIGGYAGDDNDDGNVGYFNANANV